MFFDDTLTADAAGFTLLCDMITLNKQLGNLPKKLKFWGLLRANTVTDEICIKAKEAGFIELSMGIESLSQQSLNYMRKNITIAQVENALRILKKHKIITRASFIVGAPHETEQTIKDSIALACKFPLDRISVNVMTPYPGTELWYMAKEGGKGIVIKDTDFNDYRRWGTAVVETEELTQSQLVYWQREFLRRFYTTPRVIRFYIKQFMTGHWDKYFYRPVLNAIKWSVRKYFMKEPICS
jgi:radical SAM superfamily enzyme YgiQ (UPF0313 family)